MKKIAFAFLVMILLAACQPAATPQPTAIPPTVPPTAPPAPLVTATAVETLASSVNDLLGVWWFPSPGVKLEFKTDGTFRFFYVDTTIDEGNYTFEKGQVFFTTPGTGGCYGKTSTYDAYLTKQEGQPVLLRLQVVGSDPCPGRGETTTHEAKFLNP